MNIIRHLALSAAASVAVATGMMMTAAPAVAQEVGDVKCQDDGYIYSWNSILRMWNNTFRKCDASSSRSSRSRYKDDDEGEEDDDRSERRSSRRNNDSGSSGPLATGDKKCSPDGYVMTYYAALKKWSTSSYSRC